MPAFSRQAKGRSFVQALQIGNEILGQPELTPFRLTNKEAELTGTISCLYGDAKKGRFYGTFGEFERAYRGNRFVRARRFRLASPTVTWGSLAVGW